MTATTTAPISTSSPKTHSIDLTASYYDPKGLPPRCRVPQPSIFTVRTTADILEINPATFTLAATIGETNLFTTTAAPGFYVPCALTQDFWAADFVEAGLSGQVPREQRDKALNLRESLFELQGQHLSNIKIADPALAKVYGEDWGDVLYTLKSEKVWGEDQDPQQAVIEHLQGRAACLLIAGERVYRRIMEPRVLVQVSDYDSQYLIASTPAERFNRGQEQNLHLKLSLISQDSWLRHYDTPASVPTDALVPLPGVGAVIEQLTNEIHSMSHCTNPVATIEAFRDEVAGLGVTVYAPDLFTPATLPFPSRKIRLARHRAAVLLGALAAKYGSDNPWSLSQIPAPAKTVSGWVEELEELGALCQREGVELFITEENTVSLK